MTTPAGTRLNKLLSQAGIASRRAADDLISQGRVEINGRICTELAIGSSASSMHDWSDPMNCTQNPI